MNEESRSESRRSSKRRSRRIELPIEALSRVPFLLMKLLLSLLRFERRKRLSAVVFKRELLKRGLSQEQANLLTSQYTEVISVRKILRELGTGFAAPFTTPFRKRP